MSQVLGTFSVQSGHFQITTNGLSFIDYKPDGHVEDIGFLSENQYDKIPDFLIKECFDKYQNTGVPHLILDLSDKAKILKLKGNLEEEREVKIDCLLDTKFEVVTWYDLLEMPSRQTLYDSVTQHTNLFERQKKVLEFLNSNDFKIVDLLESGFTQQELLYKSFNREISYMSEHSPRVTIRVKPNLMVEVIVSARQRGDEENDSGINNRYFFFYNPTQITSIIIENSPIDTKRELKIKNILS